MDKKKALVNPPDNMNSKDKALFMLRKLVDYYENVLDESNRKTSR